MVFTGCHWGLPDPAVRYSLTMIASENPFPCPWQKPGLFFSPPTPPLHTWQKKEGTTDIFSRKMKPKMSRDPARIRPGVGGVGGGKNILERYHKGWISFLTHSKENISTTILFNQHRTEGLLQHALGQIIFQPPTPHNRPPRISRTTALNSIIAGRTPR